MSGWLRRIGFWFQCAVCALGVVTLVLYAAVIVTGNLPPAPGCAP